MYTGVTSRQTKSLLYSKSVIAAIKEFRQNYGDRNLALETSMPNLTKVSIVKAFITQRFVAPSKTPSALSLFCNTMNRKTAIDQKFFSINNEI